MDNSSQNNLVRDKDSKDIPYSPSQSPLPPYDEVDNGAIPETLPPNNQPIYKMYKRRWIGMSVIILLNIATACVWLTFNAVSSISERWLHASLSEVNLSSTLYFLGSIVTSSFSGFVFEKWGIKVALIVGGCLNLAGCWIRYFASFIDSTEENHEARLVVVLIGQFIGACAQPFFLNAPPKYSAVWFSDSSRAIATTIGTVSNPVGIAVVMVMIPAICKEESGDDMPLTLLVIGIISIVALLPAFFIPEEPPTPPSASAEIALAEAKDESFVVALKKVSRNTQFWLLFIAFSISVAIFNSVTSLINQIVKPYGYDDDEAGYFGASFIVVGIFGAAISGLFVDKTKKYKEVLKCAAPCLGLGYIVFIFVIRENFFPWICIICGYLGFVSFALLPVALELGVECTYPCPPSTSTSVLWMGGQAAAVVFLTVGDALRNKSPFNDEPEDTMTTALICAAAVSFAVGLLSFSFTSRYYRLEAEAERMNSHNIQREIENFS